jgi:class 3 adenylate cyclase/pimeloyl-ACP methyl ester carboxylesterase/acyl dehydratase
MDHQLAYFARPDGVTLAYGLAGTGPPLVLVMGWTTHLDWFFRHPASLLFEPLTPHVRLITFDKHGSGLSDRDRTEFTLDSEVYDIEALVDHLGLERFLLMGMSEGGLSAAAYAAKHPDRVDKLVLYSTTANGPALGPDPFKKSFVEIIRSAWGMGSKSIADLIVPDASKEEQEEFARAQREAASADVAANLMDLLYHTDIRPLLPQIQAQTLVIHRRSSRAFPPRNGRVLAAGIPNSRAVIIPGVAHYPPAPGDPNTIEVVNEILDFLVPGTEAQAVRHKDTFRTVMFTDVEASTQLVARLGDTTARDMLRRHDAVCRRAVAEHGGLEIKTMGDGFMVSFTSTSSALDTAIAIQEAVADEFADGQEEIRVRIGIHAGEPIAEDDDLHGTAVIMASRIMDAASGGEIMVSSLVRELVAGRDYRFVGRGPRSLKGFEESVPLFELDWRHIGPTSTAAAAALILDERVGDDPQNGEWHQVTSQQVRKYATATDDPDSNSSVVPPMLLVSLLTQLVSSITSFELPADGLVMGINYGFESIRFGDTVAIGSRVRARSETKTVDHRDTAVHVTSEVMVEVEGRNDPALTAEWIIRAQYKS